MGYRDLLVYLLQGIEIHYLLAPNILFLDYGLELQNTYLSDYSNHSKDLHLICNGSLTYNVHTLKLAPGITHFLFPSKEIPFQAQAQL